MTSTTSRSRRPTLAMILFRPDIEHLLCLIIFCLISTIGFVVWTYEDRLIYGSSRRLSQLDDGSSYDRVIESFIEDEQRLRELREDQFPEFPDADESEDVPVDNDVLGRHRRRRTQSPMEKEDGVLKQIDKNFKSKKRKNNRRKNPTKGKEKEKKKKEPELIGGEAFCSVYDLKREINDSFECVKITFKPPVQVCLYPDAMDVHVSRHLRESGIWEPHILRHFQNLLYQDPSLGVYDIGAHVGEYTLLAASMGRQVVAVEPHLPSQRRLHKAIKLGKLEDKIILVTNAVSDRRDTYELSVPSDNQGGVSLTSQDADRFCTDPDCPPHATTIVLDDLLEVTNFEKAIIKIDIEGHEHRALVRSRRLFRTVDVQFIIMEWIKLREYYDNEAHSSPDKRLVFEMIDYLVEMGYTPRGSLLNNRLDPRFWYGWPDDVFWEATAVRTKASSRKNDGSAGSRRTLETQGLRSVNETGIRSSSSTVTPGADLQRAEGARVSPPRKKYPRNLAEA